MLQCQRYLTTRRKVHREERYRRNIIIKDSSIIDSSLFEISRTFKLSRLHHLVSVTNRWQMRCLGWELSDEEVEELDKACKSCGI